MLDAEREQLVNTAVNTAAERIPIIIGTSHKGTLATRGLCQMAADLGASGVMVTPSLEPMPNEERVFEYFQRIADGLSIPMVVQDHPASTQVHMSIPLLLRLVRELPQVACFKEEEVPTSPRVQALIQGMTERRVPVLTGLGALYGLFDLRSGRRGFMTGFAFPEVLMSMVQAIHEQRPQTAAAIYRYFLPLIADASVRHPGAALNPTAATQLTELLEELLPGCDLTQRLDPFNFIAQPVTER